MRRINNFINLKTVLLTVLEPVREATVIMCADNYPTLSQYLPLYIGLTKVLRADNTQSEKMNEISNHLCDALKVILSVLYRNK